MNGCKSGLFRLALKNLSRNKVKTVLTMAAIVAGVVYFIYISSLYAGIKSDSFRSLINYETGAAIIYAADYYPQRDELPLTDLIDNFAEIQTALGDDYLLAPRVRFGGMAISPDLEIPFTVVGVDPHREKEIFQYPRDILVDSGKNQSGRFIEPGAYEIVMGIRGAIDLGLNVGDPVRIVTNIEYRDGDRIRMVPQILEYTLVGVINSSNPRINSYTAFVPRDVLNDEFGLMLEGNISEISLRRRGFSFQSLPNEQESPEVVTSMLPESVRSELVVTPWSVYAEDFLSAMAQDPVHILFYFFIVLIIVLISNTMLLATMSRTREIGIIRAMGMTNRDILKLFALESGLLGFLGGLTGLIGGGLLTWYFVENGITITTEMLELTDMPYPVVGRVHASWDLMAFLYAFVVSVATAVLSAILPTKLALDKSVIAAIRME